MHVCGLLAGIGSVCAGRRWQAVSSSGELESEECEQGE